MHDKAKNVLSWITLAALFFAWQFAPLEWRDFPARLVFAALALACLWIALIQIGILRVGGEE